MIEFFLLFEKENQLFDEKISDIKFWHLIRVNIYNDIKSKKNNLPEAHRKSHQQGSLKHITKKIKQYKYISTKNPFINLKQKDILIFNHPRRVLDDGAYKCLYTSDLVENLSDNYLMIENAHDLSHYRPIPEKNIKYNDILNLKYNFLNLIRKKNSYKMLNEKDEVKLKKLLNKISIEFNIELNIKDWLLKIDNKILLYTLNYEAYKKIIKKINPKVIIEVVSYANNLFEVNKIAKELKIPTIELQHGTMGKYHIAYNFHRKINIDSFPDYIFTFGDYWKENTRLPIDDFNIIPVGWPYYENKVKEFTESESESEEKTILFISQGTIGEQLSKVARELSENVYFKNYRIIYKLHPGEYSVWREKYPWLLNTEIKVIDNNIHDMHYYFGQVDIQVGVNSTAIFEGLGYSLRTYVVKLHGYQYMEDLYKSDYVTLVTSSDDIVNDLRNNHKSLGSIDQDYFWKSNSMENMIKEINKVIKN